MAMQRQPRPPPDPEYVLRGHRTDVQALLFPPKMDLLYSGDAEGGLLVWDLHQRRPVSSHRLHPANAGVLSLAWLGNDLLSQGRDGTIKVWGIAEDGSCSREPILVLRTNSYNFCRCSVIPHPSDGSIEKESNGEVLLAEGSEEGRAEAKAPDRWLVGLAGSDPATVEVWEVVGLEARRWRELKQREDAKMGMCMALQLLRWPESGIVHAAAGYEDGTVAVWNVSQPDSPKMSGRMHSEPVMALAMDPSGKWGVSGSADDRLTVFSLDWEQQEVHQQATITLKKPGVAAVAVRHDGRIFAVAGWDARVRLFRCDTQKPLAVLQYHRSGVQDVCFDPRTKRLASASKDGSIAMWNVYTDAQAYA